MKRNGGRGTIPNPPPTHNDAERHARLIAAAPDLLALVRWSCAWANGWRPSAKERKAHHQRCLAAIAKASQP